MDYWRIIWGYWLLARDLATNLKPLAVRILYERTGICIRTSCCHRYRLQSCNSLFKVQINSDFHSWNSGLGIICVDMQAQSTGRLPDLLCPYSTVCRYMFQQGRKYSRSFQAQYNTPCNKSLSKKTLTQEQTKPGYLAVRPPNDPVQLNILY